jgi:predicted phosphodiesterase
MKIAIINDTHAGVKNGSDVFLDYSQRFYENTFFPYLLENDIKKIIHLGDYFDHRKFVNFKVLKRNYDHFISKLEEYGMTMDIIPGNHDVYYKNTNELNSLNEILGHYDGTINIWNDPTTVTFGSLDILMLPWISVDNYETSMAAIKESKASVVAGHLELANFEVMRGVTSKDHGMDHKIFERFDMVLSGHYHAKSHRDNIHYLGTQLQLTFSDANEDKFFHVLDTETRELTSIKNNDSMFHRLIYDEDSKPIIDDRFSGTYVKVVVLNKKDLYGFDRWFDQLQRTNPFEIKVAESFEEYLGENVEDDSVSTADTQSLLNSYIDSTETNLNRSVLKKLMQELYVEAQTLDEI